MHRLFSRFKCYILCVEWRKDEAKNATCKARSYVLVVMKYFIAAIYTNFTVYINISTRKCIKSSQQ